jgi:YidC/Oxa1 family membrane protein insertase
MTPGEDKPNFLDRGTILAFAIILVFWLGWSKFMEAKYPQPPTSAAAAAGQANGPDGKPTTDASNPQAATAPGTTAPSGAPAASDAAASTHNTGIQPAPEVLVDYSDPTWSFSVSSHGMGLKNIDIKSYKTRSNEPIILASAPNHPTFSTELISTDSGARKVVDFQVEKAPNGDFVGHATVDGLQIEKTLKVNSATHSLDSEVKVSAATAGAMQTFKGLITTIDDALNETTKASMFSPPADFQNWLVLHEGEKTRKPLHRKDGLDLSQDNVNVAALSAHYFALAIDDHSPLRPRFEAKIPANSELANAGLIYKPVSPSDTFLVKYTAFAGPKSFTELKQIDDDMTPVIDYGMFAVIAKPILWLLRYIYDLIGNWGFAIIILTIIVRGIVMPFNIFSYKSMKVMQKLQPEMAKIRERYKDKSSEEKLQMNQEIMQLMKVNKANPVGSCLPMLLQFPVFLALYQVLGQSIELYRAPFIFWINDLSSRDPYFVLPILMGITMFVNQKITPTTMDPQQAKILMWMPVVFSVFMVSLPSGLTLYIFVSTLFGIIQQYVFMRDRSKTT